MSHTSVSSPHAWITAGVLQTETGLVALSNLSARGGVQKVVVTERLHAVVMSLQQKPYQRNRTEEIDTD